MDCIAFTSYFFLNDHCINTAGHTRSCEDTNSLAFSQSNVYSFTCRYFAYYCKGISAEAIHITEAIAIHSRIRKRRYCDRSEYMSCQIPSEGFYKRYFYYLSSLNMCLNEVFCLICIYHINLLTV